MAGSVSFIFDTLRYQRAPMGNPSSHSLLSLNTETQRWL